MYAFLMFDGFRPELPGVKENITAPSEMSSVDIHSWLHFPREKQTHVAILKCPLLQSPMVSDLGASHRAPLFSVLYPGQILPKPLMVMSFSD